MYAGDSLRRSEKIVKILNCAFQCDYYHYYPSTPTAERTRHHLLFLIVDISNASSTQVPASFSTGGFLNLSTNGTQHGSEPSLATENSGENMVALARLQQLGSGHQSAMTHEVTATPGNALQSLSNHAVTSLCAVSQSHHYVLSASHIIICAVNQSHHYVLSASHIMLSACHITLCCQPVTSLHAVSLSHHYVLSGSHIITCCQAVTSLRAVRQSHHYVLSACHIITCCQAVTSLRAVSQSHH